MKYSAELPQDTDPLGSILRYRTKVLLKDHLSIKMSHLKYQGLQTSPDQIHAELMEATGYALYVTL